MAQNTTFEFYNAAAPGSSKRAKPYVAGKKGLRAVNRIRTGEDWVEKDWIDCDVHFGLDAHCLGYLYAIARASKRRETLRR